MKKKIVILLSVLAVLVILCIAYFYIIIYPYTLMGEVVYIDNTISDSVVLTLKMNPDSKFMSDEEEVDLYVGEASTYEIGDKLFVYCTSVVEDSLPRGLEAKWICRWEY